VVVVPQHQVVIQPLALLPLSVEVQEELQVTLMPLVVVLVVVLGIISSVQVREVLEQQDKALEVETDQLILLPVLVVVVLAVLEEMLVAQRLGLEV
jgi:hypothetical protein